MIKAHKIRINPTPEQETQYGQSSTIERENGHTCVYGAEAGNRAIPEDRTD